MVRGSRIDKIGVEYSVVPTRDDVEDRWLTDVLKIKELGRVLYVGAHPDDENNKLIAYLSNELFMDVAYLSITRGEGGQNFIGPETGDDLGVLRVQESLQARRIDGGRQFFTRAKDYGFSKSAEEAIAVWGEEAILEDLVYSIRAYRPDFIISRFSPKLKDRHGHHQASAILIEKAFQLAARTDSFPDQLSASGPWQARQLLWNVYAESGVKDIGGEVHPLPQHYPLFIPARNFFTGLCYAELAAESRNQHRCQAMASLATRSASFEYFEHLAGEATDEAQFLKWNGAQVDTSAERAFQDQLDAIFEAIAQRALSHALSRLVDLRHMVDRTTGSHRIQEKRDALNELLFALLGLDVEAYSSSAVASPGDEIQICLQIRKESGFDLQLLGITGLSQGPIVLQRTLQRSNEFSFDHVIPQQALFSMPAWLREGSDRGRYLSNDIAKFTTTVAGQDGLHITLQLAYGNLPFDLLVPITAPASRQPSFAKPVPVVVAPPVSATFSQSILLLGNKKAATVNLKLRQWSGRALTAKVRLVADSSCRIVPEVITVDLSAGADANASFVIDVVADEWAGNVGFEIEVDGQHYHCTDTCVDYPHIPKQQYFPKGSLKVIKSTVQSTAKRVAYVKGKEEDVATALRSFVNVVDVFDATTFLTKDLAGYDAVVLGVRLYNCTEGVSWHLDRKIKMYVEQGGLVVGQYNTDYDLQRETVGPYAIKLSANRITNANAEVQFVNVHPLLSHPNRLTATDFHGWSHDRALFLPCSWDSDFVPLLASTDEGHLLEQGLLLVAQKGSGHYIYSSLSLFRQLPLGVPGAYRIFANMLSLRTYP